MDYGDFDAVRSGVCFDEGAAESVLIFVELCLSGSFESAARH
jgi:hypothetical protein